MSIVARACCGIVHLAARHAVVPRSLDRVSADIAEGIIGAYQRLLSGRTGRQCLFEPSCSHRSIAAFREHGFRKGLIETSAQLHRCGGAYSTCTDCSGKLILITSDGSRYDASETSSAVAGIHRRS